MLNVRLLAGNYPKLRRFIRCMFIIRQGALADKAEKSLHVTASCFLSVRLSHV